MHHTEHAESSWDDNPVPARARPLRVVGICSGKGGVGKTCVSINLACVLAKRGRRVLLIDADLGLANAEILLGVLPQKHIGDIIRGRSLHEVVSAGPHGIGLLSGGSGIAELALLSDSQKQLLIAALDDIEDSYDTVVVDAGAGIGENVRFFIGACQERVLVLDPEPTSMTDAYATAKVLAESGVRELSIVVNSVRSDLEARTVFRLLTDVVQRHLPMRLQFLGAVPNDPSVGRSVAGCQPCVDLFPRSAASLAYWHIVDRYLGNRPESNLDGGLKFLWSRLLRETLD